jgi:ABC-type multidrug transport system fused ATPase/permease subunit
MLSTKNVAYSFVPPKLIQIFGTSSVVLSIIYVKLYDPENIKIYLPVITVYVVALMKLMPSISNIGNHWMGLRGLAPRLQLTYETLTDKKYLIEDGSKNFSGLKKEIKLEDVSFSYSPQKDVLSNIKLSLPKGETIAIVGESGAGKSTLADLIIRLYKPKEGKINIDGIDYTELLLSDWLKHIGMVSQDTFIFHASVRENIKMGKPDATEEEVIRAAEIANAHQFIKDLPNGYDSILGDRGLKLSGGQRQRIAIARAVIREPEILILDEATSALDNISEKVVQEALKKAGKSRTNIIIAHRLSTIEHADKIVVLSQGEVVEEGSHKELLARKEHYYNQYQRQQKDQ